MKECSNVKEEAGECVKEGKGSVQEDMRVRKDDEKGGQECRTGEDYMR